VVDDDLVVRKTVALLLGRTGYRVACAPDGEAGWTALCTERFDLLITDQEMPGLTGLELLRRLRAGLPFLPAIMISGFVPSSEPDLRSLLWPGAVIEKPFSFAVLLARVRELLSPRMAASAIVLADHQLVFNQLRPPIVLNGTPAPNTAPPGRAPRERTR